MAKLIDKVWDKNKVTWHRNKGRMVLHHLFGRKGVLKACPHFFWLVTDELHRAIHDAKEPLAKKYQALQMKDRLKLGENWVKGEGCLDQIFPECFACAMPKIRNQDRMQKGKKVECPQCIDFVTCQLTGFSSCPKGE